MTTFSTLISNLKMRSSLHNVQKPTELHISQILWDMLVEQECRTLLRSSSPHDTEKQFMGLKVHIDYANPCTLGVR